MSNSISVFIKLNIVDGSYTNHLKAKNEQYAKVYIEKKGNTYCIGALWDRQFPIKNKFCNRVCSKINSISVSLSSKCTIEKIKISSTKTLLGQILKIPYINPIARFSIIQKIFESNMEFDQQLYVDCGKAMLKSRVCCIAGVNYVLTHRDLFQENESITAMQGIVQNPILFSTSVLYSVANELFKLTGDRESASFLCKRPGTDLSKLVKEKITEGDYHPEFIETIFNWMASKKISIESAFLIKYFLGNNLYLDKLLWLSKQLKNQFSNFEILEIFLKKADINLIPEYETLFYDNILGLTKEDQFTGCKFLFNHSSTLKILCQAADYLSHFFPHYETTKVTHFILKNWDLFNKETIISCVKRVIEGKAPPILETFQYLFEHNPDAFDEAVKLQALLLAFDQGFYSPSWDQSIKEVLDHGRLKGISKFLTYLSRHQDKFSYATQSQLLKVKDRFHAKRFRLEEDKYHFWFNKAELKTSPEFYLFKFFLHCYLEDQSLNTFYLEVEDDQGDILEAIDYSGVSRQFLTDLSQSLSRKSLNGEGPLEFMMTESGAMPIASTKNERVRLRYLQEPYISKLLDQEIARAVDLAYFHDNEVPAEMKGENGKIDPQLVKKHFSTLQKQLMPFSLQEGCCYEALGKLMGMCCTANYSLGQLFNPLIYHAMKIIPIKELFSSFNQASDAILVKMYKELEKENPLVKFLRMVPDQINNAVILDYAYPLERPEALQGTPSIATIKNHYTEIHEALRNQVFTLAENDRRLPVIFKMAQGLVFHHRKEYKPNLHWTMKPEWYVAKIQGHFSKEILKEAIINKGLEHFNSWINKWIDECTDELCQKFIKAATGSETLTHGMKIKIEDYNQSTIEHLPTFHTCNSYVDMPPYPDYETFKQKLEEGIQFALIGDGFQLL